MNEDGKIMDLQVPTRKMSKSYPKGCIFLTDDFETIQRKIKKANTNPQGAGNLIRLYLYYKEKKYRETLEVLR